MHPEPAVQVAGLEWEPAEFAERLAAGASVGEPDADRAEASQKVQRVQQAERADSLVGEQGSLWRHKYKTE